jgi:hypothetical protein
LFYVMHAQAFASPWASLLPLRAWVQLVQCCQPPPRAPPCHRSYQLGTAELRLPRDEAGPSTALQETTHAASSGAAPGDLAARVEELEAELIKVPSAAQHSAAASGQHPREPSRLHCAGARLPPGWLGLCSPLLLAAPPLAACRCKG